VRVGISDRKIEIKRLEKAIDNIDRFSVEPVEVVLLSDKTNAIGETIRCKRFKQSIEEAFAEGKIDMAIVSMVDLLNMNEHSGGFKGDVRLSGILKRRDPRFVLIMRRRRSDIVPGAVILTDSAQKVERLYRLYDNICPKVESSLKMCFEKLSAGQCDAIFVNADDVKAIGKEKSLSQQFKYISCKESIPAHGQGIYGVLTGDSEKMQSIALKMSDQNTSIEFDIEEDIIGRVLKNEFVNKVECYAKVKDDELAVHVNAANDKGHNRYSVKDTLENRNLVVRKIVDRIKESM